MFVKMAQQLLEFDRRFADLKPGATTQKP